MGMTVELGRSRVTCALGCLLLTGALVLLATLGAWAAASPKITEVQPTADGYMLLGSGFGKDRAKVQVFEGPVQIPTTAVTYVADSVIAVRSKPAGLVQHKVIVAAQASNVLAFAHPVAAKAAAARPTITRVDPNSAAQGATVDVTITGANLTGARVAIGVKGVKATVRPGGTATNLPILVSVARDALPGPVTLEVTTAGGAIATPFTVVQASAVPAAPTITTVGPSAGWPDTTIQVNVWGRNLAGAQVTVRGTGVAAESLGGSAEVLRLRLQIAPDAQPGPRTLEMRTGGGNATGTFTVLRVNTPTVTDITPRFVAGGREYDLTITGTNLQLARANLRDAQPEEAVALLSRSDTQMRVRLATPPTSPPGARTIAITNAGGTATTTVTIVVPRVEGVSPSAAAPGTAADFTVSGRFLNEATVAISGTGARVTEVRPVGWGAMGVQSLLVKVTIEPNAAAGPRTLTLTTAFGTATAAFNVQTAIPTITSASPAAVPVGRQVEINLTGTSLMEAMASLSNPQPGESLRWQRVSGTHLRLHLGTLPSSPLGSRTITVTNPVGSTTITVTLVGPPVIANFNPSGAAPGTTVDVAILGRHLDGANVTFSGTGVTVSEVRPTGWGVTGVQSLLLKLTVTQGASPGSRTLTLTTPAGTATAFFNVQATPTIAGLSPNVGRDGDVVDAVLTGTNLGSVSISGTNVAVSVLPGGMTTVQTVRFSIGPGASPGPRTLTVTGPLGGTATAQFTVVPRSAAVPPAIRGLEAGSGPGTTRYPWDSAFAGTEVEVRIVGQYLTGTVSVDGPGVAVTRGAEIPTLPPGQNRAAWDLSLRIGENAPAGARTLRVTNPGGSATTTFTVHAPRPVLTGLTPNRIVGRSTVMDVDVTLSGRHLSTPTRPVVTCPPANVSVLEVKPGGSATSQSLRLRVQPYMDSSLTCKLWMSFAHPTGEVRDHEVFEIVPPPPRITKVSYQGQHFGGYLGYAEVVSNRLLLNTEVTVYLSGTNLLPLRGLGASGEIEWVRRVTEPCRDCGDLQVRVKTKSRGRGQIQVTTDGGFAFADVEIVAPPPEILSPVPTAQVGVTDVTLSTRWAAGASVSISRGAVAVRNVAASDDRVSFQLVTHALERAGSRELRITTPGGTATTSVPFAGPTVRELTFFSPCDLRQVKGIPIASDLAGGAGYRYFFQGQNLQNGWVVRSVEFTAQCNTTPATMRVEPNWVGLALDVATLVVTGGVSVSGLVSHIFGLDTGLGAYPHGNLPQPGSTSPTVSVRWWVNPDLFIAGHRDRGFRGKVVVVGPPNTSCGVRVLPPIEVAYGQRVPSGEGGGC